MLEQSTLNYAIKLIIEEANSVPGADQRLRDGMLRAAWVLREEMRAAQSNDFAASLLLSEMREAKTKSAEDKYSVL
jgi:hypothetical protein